MFLRRTRGYQEVCEAYRHPETGKPTHRCIARWSSGRTLDEEIAVLEAAYWRLVDIMTCRPEEIDDITDVYLRLGAPAHRLRLHRRLEPLRRARENMARAASRKTAEADGHAGRIF
jgi:hypothetical protein